MQRVLAKLTSKNQASVPKAVREALQLHSKDRIIYEIMDDNRVMLLKANPMDIDYLEALNHTLNEWNSDEDERAYQDL